MQGDRELAAAQAARALQIARDEEDALGEADALRILCIVHRVAGELDEAKRLGEQARDLAERIAHSWTLAEVLRDLGDVHVAAADLKAAAGCYAAAAEAFTKAGASERADALTRLARQISGNG